MRKLNTPSGILVAVLASIGASACAADSPDENVDAEPAFSAVRSDRMLARVRVGKAPVEGAILTVRRLERNGGGVLALGRSDALGLVDTPLSLLADEGEVEVVVQKRGLRAAFDDPERQSQLGHFAPSLIRRVPVEALRALDLSFDEEVSP